MANPQISPDGERLACTVGQTNLEREKSSTHSWMISMSGGDPIPMPSTGTAASRPRWSPDGKYLKYVKQSARTTTEP